MRTTTRPALQAHERFQSAGRWKLSAFGVIAVAVLGSPGNASAFSVAISSGQPSQIYLQIGVGTFTGGNYDSGGDPGRNATINRVTASPSVAEVAGTTPKAMTVNAGATQSFKDGFAMCGANQLYVGGFHRRTLLATIFGNSTATLTANSATALSNGLGQSIPFTEISWTSSGNRGTAAPFPGGTFSGTANQTIGSFPQNFWAENCHSFTFLNSTVRAGGTYTGRVTYTLTAP